MLAKGVVHGVHKVVIRSFFGVIQQVIGRFVTVSQGHIQILNGS